MSTAPQGWQNPKTNWDSKDPVGVSDLNRMEGNPLAIETGDRTLDPAQAPTGNTGTLRQILSWFANRIKAIMGTTNWWDAPPTTLAATKSHMDATSGIHGATSSATANRIIIRDSAGRAKVAAPSASDDIARKDTVDAHANATTVHGATSSATANRIIIRNSAGRAKVAAPSASDDIARKDTVDAHANRTDNPHQVTAQQAGAYHPLRFTLSGSVGGSGAIRLEEGETHTMTRIRVELHPNRALVLRLARFDTSSSNCRLYVEAAGYSAWTSGESYGQEQPNATLRTNDTGAVVYVRVYVHIRNVGGGATNVQPYASYWLELEVV